MRASITMAAIVATSSVVSAWRIAAYDTTNCAQDTTSYVSLSLLSSSHIEQSTDNASSTPSVALAQQTLSASPSHRASPVA